MHTNDCEYDGMTLSDFGAMICTFDSTGKETISSGADVTFNTIKPTGSNKSLFYGSKYDEVNTTTFYICKNDYGSDKYFTPGEVSEIQRWFCRKDGYHKLKFAKEGYEDIYWNATFSSKQVVLNDKIIGLELTVYTDSPYAYLTEQTIAYDVSGGDCFSIYDMSDEEGSIYPKVTIICNESGKIKLENSMDRKIFVLTGLSSAEIIKLDGEKKLITSSLDRKNLPSSFNFYFPRIINTIQKRENVYTLSDDSIPCTITFTYSPIIKVGL